MTRIRIQVLALVALSSTLTYAQQDNKKGYLTGSFETNTIYYKDEKYPLIRNIDSTNRINRAIVLEILENLRKIISVRTII